MLRKLMATLGIIGLAIAAAPVGAKPAPAKPKPKPTPKPTPTKGVKGTQQMAGDEGKIGTTYTLGAQYQFNFTLTGAEFTVSPVRVGTATISPTKNEKVLVLHYTLQNPNNQELYYDWGSIRFTVVDAENLNHDMEQLAGKEGTSQSLGIELKPGQKVSAWTMIRVPAAGPIPKLIVSHNAGGDVLRYDLRGKVKALAAPFADPNTPGGVTALAEVPAETGKFYPLLNHSIKLVSTAYRDTALGDIEPEEGKRFFIATFVLKGEAAAGIYYDFGSFTPTVITSDGEKAEEFKALLKATRDEGSGAELKLGEEATVRVVIALSKEVTAKTLKIAEGESRVYAFDVKDTK